MTTTPRTRRTRVAATTAPDAKSTPRRRAVEAAPGVKVRETKAHSTNLLKPGEEPKRDFTKLLDKDPNALHAEFKGWFEGHADGAVELDLKTIQIVLATYGEFQRSPEHKAKTIAQRTASSARAAEAQKAKLEKLRKAAAELAKLEAKGAK